MPAEDIRVLVTGANGLLATHIILELAKAGTPVRGLIRDRKKFLLPMHQRIELVEGDLNDLSSIHKAMDGCTHVIHAAALTSQHECDYAKYFSVNVQGTENVLLAAKACRIKRIALVSTANTLGFGSRANPGNETHAMKEPFTKSLYARSKREAEMIAERYGEELDIITLHPTYMLGAYDAGPSSGKIITMALNKRIVFCPPGGKNFIHVQDAALGIIHALTRGKRGERYLLANENLSYQEFFQHVAEVSITQPILIKVPKWLLILAGGVGDLFRALNVRTALSSTNMKILCVENYYDSAKSKVELGLSFQSTKIAVKEAVEWFGTKN